MSFNDRRVTRFADGVANRDESHIFSAMGQLDPTKFHTLMDDFHENGITAGRYVLNTSGGGTFSIVDGDGGIARLTTGGVDDNRTFLRQLAEPFSTTPGARVFFIGRFQISDAIQTDLVMGLQILVVDPLTAADGVWFQKDDGDALLDLHVANSASQSDELGILTVPSATDITIAFMWDGISRIYYGAAVGNNATPLGFVEPGANLPSTELSISFGLQTGEAAVKTMDIDYIFTAKERF